VKLKKEVMGLLVVVRKAPSPFSPSNRTLLEAVADYASISLVNARLFRVLEERARSLQQAAESAQANERKKAELIASLQRDLVKPLADVTKTIDAMLVGETMRLNAAQKSVLRSAVENLQTISNLVASLNTPT
jgi:GAF domain-containing protein